MYWNARARVCMRTRAFKQSLVCAREFASLFHVAFANTMNIVVGYVPGTDLRVLYMNWRVHARTFKSTLDDFHGCVIAYGKYK